jgi:Tol biopolymer transport system component
MLQLAALVLLAQNPAAPAVELPVPERLTWVVHAYASWSPDDRRIAYQSNAAGNWDLYVMELATGAIQRVVGDPAADITPVWSPDGARILFVSERDGDREVYVCAADGSGARNLSRDRGHDLHPVWSRDGARILFSSNRGKPDAADYDLYEMAADGSALKRLTSGPEVDTYASWSPDGRTILTRRVIDGGNNEVFLLDADGSNPRNLTNDAAAYDGWPVWSPDGKRIAFASGPGGAPPHRIQIMDADGRNRRSLTDATPSCPRVNDTQPAFAHDGQRLAFTRYRPGERESSELCVLDLRAI